MSARRLLVLLGGTLAVLLTVFMAWGLTSRVAEPAATPPETAAEQTQAAARYAPKGLAVTQGPRGGELTVTWRMPIRPDVVATVIYEGSGGARARAIVSYSGGSHSVPQATLHGLPRGRRVCLSVANVASVGDKITNAVSSPLCAAPR